MNKTPFLRLTINRFGFSVLDVTFSVVSTENIKDLSVMLISQVTGRDPKDDNEFIRGWYDDTLTKYAADPENGYHYFYIGDDLISFIRFDK